MATDIDGLDIVADGGGVGKSGAGWHDGQNCDYFQEDRWFTAKIEFVETLCFHRRLQ